MATHRRYTKHQKATAVIAAEMASVAAAAEQTGIPRTTLIHWMDDPEMVELRQKTRDERAEMAAGMSVLVLTEIKRRLPEFDPKDLSTLYGILTDKGQLLGGMATSRTETRDLTAALDDHEQTQLRQAIDEWLSTREPV